MNLNFKKNIRLYNDVITGYIDRQGYNYCLHHRNEYGPLLTEVLMSVTERLKDEIGSRDQVEVSKLPTGPTSISSNRWECWGF